LRGAGFVHGLTQALSDLVIFFTRKFRDPFNVGSIGQLDRRLPQELNLTGVTPAPHAVEPVNPYRQALMPREFDVQGLRN